MKKKLKYKQQKETDQPPLPPKTDRQGEEKGSDYLTHAELQRALKD